MAIELDIKHVYDRMSWKFLIAVLPFQEVVLTQAWLVDGWAEVAINAEPDLVVAYR